MTYVYTTPKNLLCCYMIKICVDVCQHIVYFLMQGLYQLHLFGTFFYNIHYIYYHIKAHESFKHEVLEEG